MWPNINKSLVVFKKSLKECLTRVNQEAGTLLSKGSYVHAESFVDVAKSIETFRAEVESRHVRDGASRTSPSSKLDMEPFEVHSRG